VAGDARKPKYPHQLSEDPSNANLIQRGVEMLNYAGSQLFDLKIGGQTLERRTQPKPRGAV